MRTCRGTTLPKGVIAAAVGLAMIACTFHDKFDYVLRQSDEHQREFAKRFVARHSPESYVTALRWFFRMFGLILLVGGIAGTIDPV